MADAKRKTLPTHLKPVFYDIRLEPDFEEQSFSGHVEISCDVVEITRSIHLHCKLIHITSAFAEYDGHHWDLEKTIKYDEPGEIVEMTIGIELPPAARLKIILTYKGKFKNDLAGFYQAHYTAEDGTECLMAVTSMEPTYARQVFPCFDEPNLKAEFIISTIIHSSLICVSNMPIDYVEKVSDSKKLVVFDKSVLMPTYLVALIAGPLAQVRSTKSRIPLSIFCPIDSEADTEFALDLAWKGLEFFENLFDSLYPLPKLDLVAVPDFSAGAMENWGVIMFRSSALLMDPDDSALDRGQHIAETILHEIAHMWFGNLVTMKYWDGLWLKEGFATLMAWLSLDKFFPSWHIWDSYVLNDLQLALELDSLKSSHPVELLVQDATEAKQLFDDISYKKGCCVLKMILIELGENKFLEGVKLYIHRHKFRNTISEDLWRALEDCTGEAISTKMHVWTKQTGYPLVSVTEQIAENEGHNKLVALHLRQDRFITSELDGRQIDSQIYPLRIAIRSESGVEMINMNEREIIVPAHGRQLLKVNADHDGFFRTSYSPGYLQTLIQAAIDSRLSLRDCIGLSSDIKSLVVAGVNRTSSLLDLSLGFKKLSSYLLWESIDRNLREIRSAWKFQSGLVREALNKVTLDIIGTKANELGWNISEGEDHTSISFKASMFSGAGLAGDQKIIAVAQESFAKRVAGNGKAISPHLRWEVFGLVAAYGGKRELEALLNIWQTSSNEDEKYLALECLGRAGTSELVKWVIDLAFTEDVKDQDLYLLLWLVSSSPHGAVEIWKWTKANWDRVENSVPVDMQCTILGVVLDGLNTRDQVDDVKAYFANRDTKNYSQLLSQKLEKMEICRRWVEHDADDVKAWLENHGYLEKR